jgi:hypothetical protein
LAVQKYGRQQVMAEPPGAGCDPGSAVDAEIGAIILLGCGLLGAAFGLVGAWQLAEPVARLFADLSHTGLMQTVLLTCGTAAFYVWFMNEDLGLVN